MMMTLAILGSPMVVLARYLLLRRGNAMGVPVRIRWFRLVLTTIVIGGLFVSVWLIPVLWLLPANQGPQKEGAAYIAGMAILQMVAVMPVICGLPSVARRFLSNATS